MIPLEAPDEAHPSVKQVAKLLMQFYKQRQQAALQTATTFHDGDESTPNEKICALLGLDKVAEFAEIKGTVKLPIHQAAAVVLAAVKRKRLNAATPDKGIPEAKRMNSVGLGTPCTKKKMCEETPPRTGDPDEKPAPKRMKPNADNKLAKKNSPAKPVGTDKGKITREASRSNWRVRHALGSKSFSFKEYGNEKKALSAALDYLHSL